MLILALPDDSVDFVVFVLLGVAWGVLEYDFRGEVARSSKAVVGSAEVEDEALGEDGGQKIVTTRKM